LEGIETGDVKVLGVTTVGSVLGAGCAATVGNVGVGIAGTAFGIGMGTMAITGGLFALGAYQLIKMFAKSGQVESYDQVFSRMETQISENEFYIQALLELDPVLQELTWYGKFANLDADYELQQFKKILELEQNQGDYPWQNISDDEELKKLKLELGQIIKENSDEEKI
jgi:hypothetical protein